jgi:hypothetical protein
MLLDISIDLIIIKVSAAYRDLLKYICIDADEKYSKNLFRSFSDATLGHESG